MMAGKTASRLQRALVTVGILCFVYALLGNYLALPGYVRFLERGRISAAGNGFDMAVLVGATKTVLWLFSFQLGLFFLTLAALLRANARRGLRWTFVLLALAWLGFAGIQSLPRAGAPFYIVFGSLILVLIAIVIWRWSNLRPSLEGPDLRAHDFRLFGYLFFAMAAWDVCGFGSMGFMLHPEKAAAFETGDLLATQSTKVMIEFVLGWTFSLLSMPPNQSGSV